MSTCAHIGCEQTVVWVVTHSLGPATRWCNKHAVRFHGYRQRASLPAGSPQLTLSEVAVL